MKIIFPFLNLVLVFFLFQSSFAQQKHGVIKKTYRNISHKKPVVKYGLASYYADKFHAHRTANGEKYNHSKNTAACNVFPINTRIRVTNLSNQRSLILKINDRLSKKNKRLVDVSKSAAKKLGFLSKGITKVKVEALTHH